MQTAEPDTDHPETHGDGRERAASDAGTADDDKRDSECDISEGSGHEDPSVRSYGHFPPLQDLPH